MHRTRRGYLTAGCLVWLALGSHPSEAQYTNNFQTNVISGGVSNWTGNYLVGSNTFADVLRLRNVGRLSVQVLSVGYEVGSSNNSVVVTDINSELDTVGEYLGRSGAGNSLVISNRGQVINLNAGPPYCYVGYNATSSNNSVLVSDTGSVWNCSYGLYLGYSGAGNSLVISNGGQLIEWSGSGDYVGYNTSSSNNSVLITGPGSVWKSQGPVFCGKSGGGNHLVISSGGKLAIEDALELGNSSTGNSLVISNGGQVVLTGIARVGANFSGSNNTVLITGPGSGWTTGNMDIGTGAHGNSLVISNGGQMVISNGFGNGLVTVGFSSSNNSVRVVDGGAWLNQTLDIGFGGSSNTLVVDGGTVVATNLVVGFETLYCDNLVQLDAGSIVVTNAGDGVLEVSGGALILNGGTLLVDTLLITNSCARFYHKDGTLIVGNVVLDPNLFRIVSVTRQGNDMLITWMMGPGATNTLQAEAGDGSGGYNTNGFTDIFIVTNNTAIGTVTNYLDIGAATNQPARYYRARLVL